MSGRSPDLAGRRLLILSRRDVRHPAAGGLERYLFEIARRWVLQGARVSWVNGGAPGAGVRDLIDGVTVLRLTEPFRRRPRTALRLLRDSGPFDAVVDATDGLTFAVPFVTGRRTPVVQVAYQARSRTTGERITPAARLGRLLAGPAADWSCGDRVVVTPSPAGRHELRRHAGFRGPIFVVPPGQPTADRSTPRAADPTIVVDARLLPQQRVDVLLRALAQVADQLPGLHVRILGDGPELPRLRAMARRMDLASVVALPGYVSDAERDAWLSQAWLAVSTASADLCGCALLRAAAHGVPSVALDGPGVGDFIRAGRTGQVVDSPEQLGPALLHWLRLRTDPKHTRRITQWCRGWADRFQWDRTARLFAGVIDYQIGAVRSARRGGAQRRCARSDIATLVRLSPGTPRPTGALRVTDEVTETDGVVSLLLNGCDEFDALGVLDRLGVEAASVRLAGHDDLLAGPHPIDSVRHLTTHPGPAAARQRHRVPAPQKG